MPGLYRTPEEKKDLEVRNGVIQSRAILYYAETWETEHRSLTPDLTAELQRLAINQIYDCAGSFRTGPVKIAGVSHQPPLASEVPQLVAEMCEYIKANWEASAIHLASYLMWRINWIHPFFGGNGRTSRAVSYLIMCARLQMVLPGELTIPAQIEAERKPYYDALRHADESWLLGRLDVSKMEDLLSSMLAKQLVSIHNAATGKASSR